MKGFLKRFVRTLIPILAVVGTDAGTEMLKQHPVGTLLVLPIVAAAGKGIRELWPNSKVSKLWPF